MTLQKGVPLLLQQFKALLWKNLLLSWRNRRATFVQIFASFFFLLIMFIVQKSIDGPNGSPNLEPESLVFPPIPRCEHKYFIRRPCYDFVWSGNSSDRVSQIVDRIRANNPGRPIPPSKVISFATSEEVDTWLVNNPNRCSGALHFEDRNTSVIGYGIETNSTSLKWKGQQESPVLKFQIPLQIAAEREIARFLNSDPALSWSVGFTEFPQPQGEVSLAMDVMGPTFFLASAMFGFVFQMSSLVMEKQLKLRQLVTQFGFPYDIGFPSKVLTDRIRFLWSFYPPSLLAKAITLL